MRAIDETREKVLHLGASAAIFAAMISGGLLVQISDGQTDPVQFDVVSVRTHTPENREGRMELLPNGVRLSNLPLQT